jgi:hypothetical protein
VLSGDREERDTQLLAGGARRLLHLDRRQRDAQRKSGHSDDKGQPTIVYMQISKIQSWK